MIRGKTDSVTICKTINVLLDVLKERGHYIMDDDNPDCAIDSMHYDSGEDRLYFKITEI